MVTAPASTGIVAISRKAVISQPQQKIGSFIIVIPGARRLKMVTMTLIEPRIELMPRMCSARIAKSTPSPPCTDSGA